MKFSNTTSHKIFTLVFCGALSSTLFGQASLNNPYSQLGIGLLSAQGSVKSFSMAGITVPLFDATLINFGNPASYAYLKQPVFQAGISGHSSTLTDNRQNSSSFKGASISEIGLAFKKEGGKWAGALGLMPFSRVGYNMENKMVVNDSVTARYNYRGDGGINRLTAGISRILSIPVDTATHKNHTLSIGINLNYYFGSISHYRRVIFDNTTFLNSRTTRETNVSDINAELGVLYSIPLQVVREGKKVVRGKHLIIGVDYSLPSGLHARTTELGQTYSLFSGVEVVADTSYSHAVKKTNPKLPAKLKVGASLLILGKEGSSIIIAGEYASQNWKNFSLLSDDDLPGYIFSHAQSIGGAIEYIPTDISRDRGFLKKIQYRTGYRNTQTYLAPKGSPLQQKAFSAGLSFPFFSSKTYGFSYLSIGAEYGMSSTTHPDLLKEKFLHFQIGFSLVPFENWFQPVRYD